MEESSSDPRQQPDSLYLVGLSDSAPPPPPSPEKTRRELKSTKQRRRIVDQKLQAAASEHAKLELEVEQLLENTTPWRRTRQPRIRTPVRRVVLGYSTGVSSAGPVSSSGRRHAVLRDLSARVRELDVDALSRGIASSLTMKKSISDGTGRVDGLGEEAAALSKASVSAVGSARLDPRVRKMYQEIMPNRSKTITLPEAAGKQEPTASIDAATFINGSKVTAESEAWPPRDSLPARQSSHRKRLQSVRSRAATEAQNSSSKEANETDIGFPRPVRRAKTSFTLAGSVLGSSRTSSRFGLLQQRQINGEIQRSLYTERTHGLRRLLQPGEENSYIAGSHNSLLLQGGLVGIGSPSRRS